MPTPEDDECRHGMNPSFWTKELGPIAAYQWSYIQWVGPIPAGLCVCHACDNRPYFGRDLRRFP
jgi:hypothetical protein